MDDRGPRWITAITHIMRIPNSPNASCLLEKHGNRALDFCVLGRCFEHILCQPKCPQLPSHEKLKPEDHFLSEILMWPRKHFPGTFFRGTIWIVGKKSTVGQVFIILIGLKARFWKGRGFWKSSRVLFCGLYLACLELALFSKKAGVITPN